ncbi:MAG TPA: hypothetical protein VFZ31_06635 [Vicinamibacterales bacterium]
MATSRSEPRGVALLFVVLGLACAGQVSPASNITPRNAELAAIQTLEIEHLTPRRDFVGPVPARLEWTAIAGVDSYAIKVEDEIEIPVFDQEGITTNSVPWPKEVRIPPGTYFWRIVGVKGGRLIADSGRAAFVVRDP